MATTSNTPAGRRPRRRWWLIALIAALIAAALLTAAVPLWRRYKAKRDVDVLVTALSGFVTENGRAPTGTASQIAALLRGENVGGQNPRRLDYVVARFSEMNPDGEFIDPWRTPYRIQTEPQPRAYSCGPNRQDENGAGDDIRSWK